MNINLSMLNKALDGLWLRQQSTMNNIANFSTPGYKSKFVDFESMLKNKIEAAADNSGKKSDLVNEIIESGIIVDENDNQTLRLDGNNVDLEKENLDLVKSQFQYMYASAEMTSYFSKLRAVISEGKK